MDIATLGYSVDTSQVKSATRDLDDHSAAANRAAGAAQGFSDKSGAGAPKIEGATTSIRMQREQFRALAEAAAMTGGPLGDMISRSGLLYIGSLRVSAGLIATTVGVSALVAGVVKAVEAYAAFESRQASLNNALNATSGASGQTAKGLDEFSKQLAKSGTQSVSDIQAAEAELLKFRGVSGDVFTKTLKLSQDLAATGFTDLGGAAKALGSALQDPRTATEALKGVSLELSTAQQRLATDLYNSGKASQAILVILKAMSDQTAGANARSADTLNGAYGRLTASGGGLLESWGKQIAEGTNLRGILDGIAAQIERAVRASKEAADQQATLRALGAAARAGTLVNGGLPPPQPPSADDLRAEAIEKFKRGIGASISAPTMAGFPTYPTADEEKQLKNFEAVNDALKEQMKTAGMSAQQLETYRNVVAATALGNDNLSASLRSQISAQVNANNAAKDTRQIVDAGKTQVANLQIEAQAFDMTAGASAAYRYEQQALAAERIKGTDLGAKQIAQIHDEAQALAQTTQELEKVKVAGSISFSQKTVFFTPEDVQIAQQLKGLYGNDITAAMNSSEAAALRLVNQVKALSDTGRDAAAAFAVDFKNGLQQGQTAWQSFEAAGVSALNKIADKLIQMAVNNLWEQAFGGASSGLFGGLVGSLFGSTSSPLAGSDPLEHAATGASFGPGQWATVGENGFELLKTEPGGGATVYSNSQSRQILGMPGFSSGGGFDSSGRTLAPPSLAAVSRSDIKIYPVAGTTFDQSVSSDGSVTLIGRMIDDKIKRNNKSLPARIAAFNRDPRLR